MLASLFLLAMTGPLDVEGVWWTDNQESQVEITREGDSVVGRIIWYTGHEEELAFDTKNPDEAARDQEILGLAIISGFEKGGDKWKKGEIYDPTEGKTYRSALSRKDEDTLNVQGCVGFICRTLEWEAVADAQVMRIDRDPKVRSERAD